MHSQKYEAGLQDWIAIQYANASKKTEPESEGFHRQSWIVPHAAPPPFVSTATLEKADLGTCQEVINCNIGVEQNQVRKSRDVINTYAVRVVKTDEKCKKWDK